MARYGLCLGASRVSSSVDLGCWEQSSRTVGRCFSGERQVGRISQTTSENKVLTLSVTLYIGIGEGVHGLADIYRSASVEGSDIWRVQTWGKDVKEDIQ